MDQDTDRRSASPVDALAATRRTVLGTAAKGAGAVGLGLGATGPAAGRLRAFQDDATPEAGDDASPVAAPEIGGVVPTAQMQEVLDELVNLNKIPLESQTPFNARNLPNASDAVLSLLSKRGEPAQEQVADVEHILIPTPNGDLVARVYTPEGQAPHPVIVYFHGGGWVIADLRTYDGSCRALCNAAPAVVVSVAYRQAPENPFPAAADDAYFSFQYIAENAGEVNGDPERVAVAGESAGGNLATVTCILARDQGGIAPVHQLLVYPVTTFLPEGEAAGSIEQFALAQPLSAGLLRYFGDLYVPTEADRGSPTASPLLADLADLPPATIIAAEIDPLVGQGRQYDDALEAAGVDASYRLYESVTHEFFGMGALVDEANDAVAVAAERLTESFEG